MKLTRFEIENRELKRELAFEKVLGSVSKGNHKVVARRLYLLQHEDKIDQNVIDVFHDRILEKLFFKDNSVATELVVEVTYLPGVTDNSGRAAQEALMSSGFKAQVASGIVYFIDTDVDKIKLRELVCEHLANPLIQKISISTGEEFNRSNRFTQVQFPKVVLNHSRNVEEINLNISKEDAQKLITERCLALSEEEWSFIVEYFKSSEVISYRKKVGLPHNPTDVEMEIIAQSWSEHCKHKIFASEIDFVEKDDQGNQKSSKISSLYKSFIKKATFDAKEKHKLPWLVSVFSDNAGIVRFDPKVDLCIKVETHNSPSALDPYGGALTGILGVNRDIMGTGMGARPISNMDVFCFGSPSLPLKGYESEMPDGPKSPRNIFRGVHKGIEDGGNKSGIPTVNGSIFFHDSYCGKPLVFCGTVGVMPQKLNDNRDAHGKFAKSGDKVVVIGGAVGADGIHGATFSSLELDENSPATAVQIGDPITQRRCLDFLLEARDLCLYSSITDNGAGGISSSIGEMARETNGAKIDLAKCTLKYPGLSPWEIMISESQERMSLAVPETKLSDFCALAKRRGVDVQVLGEFTNSGRFEILYNERLVADLSLEWLHEKLPQMKLSAVWDGGREYKSWRKTETKINSKDVSVKSKLLKIINSDNVASKELWVRQYDHEVQGATHIKPFISQKKTSPSNSGAIWLKPHGGADNGAVFIGHGLAPKISQYDPYLMAQMAVDESVRNILVQGADPSKICLLDNFCWPDPVKSLKNPDGDYKLGQLVKTCQGLYDIATHYGHPFVSGKDSMKNDFRGKNKNGDPLQISVLPTLLVTSMGYGSITHSISPFFMQKDLEIAIVGKLNKGLLGSEYAEHFELSVSNRTLPAFNMESNYKLYKKFFQAQSEGLIKAASDVSEGGLLTTLSEMSFCNEVGVEINFQTSFDLDTFFFGESAGRLVVGVNSSDKDKLKNIFNDDIDFIGKCHSDHFALKIQVNDLKESVDLNEIYTSWNKNWNEVNS